MRIASSLIKCKSVGKLKVIIPYLEQENMQRLRTGSLSPFLMVGGKFLQDIFVNKLLRYMNIPFLFPFCAQRKVNKCIFGAITCPNETFIGNDQHFFLRNKKDEGPTDMVADLQ